MPNLKIPCPNKTEFSTHPLNCLLCGGNGYTVVPAEFTDEKITEFVIYFCDSVGETTHKVIKDGFGRIIKTEIINER